MSSPSARRDLPWLLAIAFVGFVLRFVAVAQYEASHPNAAHVVIDEKSYDAWARAIADGDWIGQGVFFQEPLYPYALGTLYSIVGESLHAARVAHCLLWAATVVLVGLLARRAFGRVACFVAAALIAAHGPGLIFPSLILKENLFLPVYAALVLLVVRSRPLAGKSAYAAWLAIGALGGFGALLRGNVLVLLPVLAAWPIARAAIRRDRIARAAPLAAAFVVGAALVLLPVAWRNQRVGGVFALTTSGAGTNVYGGNNAENPYGRATEFSFVRGIPEHEAGDWKNEAERRSGRALDAGEVSSFWLRAAWDSVRERPAMHARILWNKLRLSLGAYEVPDNHMLAWDARYVAIARLPWPDFGVTGMLGVAGVLAWVALVATKRRPIVPCAGGATELAILFAFYLGTIVLTVTSDRARLPLLVPLAAFAGFYLVHVVAWIRVRARFELGVAAVALALAAVAAHVSALPASDRDEDWDERDYNLAVQWIDEPEREADGRRVAESLAAKHPHTARIRLLVLAYDHRRASRLHARDDGVAGSAGRAQLEDVLRRSSSIADDPAVFPRERFRADVLAAYVAAELGDSITAERRYSSARRFDPTSAELRDGQARARLAWAARLASFEDGRFVVRDEVTAEERRAGVERALDTLQLVAVDRDVDPVLRADARRLAGWIQYGLDRLPNAERHFRASLDLADNGDARAGLARVLAARAKATSEAGERVELVRAARALAETIDPALRASSGLAGDLEALGDGR